MRLQKNNLVQVIGLALLIIMFFDALVRSDDGAINFTVLCLVCLNFLYCWSHPKDNVIFLLFNFTFFLFLSSRYLVALINPDFEAGYYRPDFSSETSLTMASLSFVSLILIRLAYSIGRSKWQRVDPKVFESPYYQQVRLWAERTLIAVIIPYVVIMAERIVFVTSNGYESYYISFKSALPLPFIRLGNLYEPILFLYLATLPKRREANRQLLLYVILSTLSLGFGQRNGFALGVIFAFLYLALRDLLTPNTQPWLSKRLVLFSFMIAPVLIIFMAAFTYIRSSEEFMPNSILDLSYSFFVGQGSALFNLGYTIEYYNFFETGKFYSFGPIINFFRENLISQLVFNIPIYPPASVELAKDGYNFSFALAYIVNPEYYARGGGFGSNFIAELWIDFGLTGVVIGSVAYGYMMAAFPRWLKQRGPFFVALALAGSLNLIYSPRAEFLGFIMPLLSMPTVTLYLFIHLVASHAKRLKLPG